MTGAAWKAARMMLDASPPHAQANGAAFRFSPMRVPPAGCQV
jgi:hypothetical protein